MDNPLLHRFLDLGIAIAASISLGDVVLEEELERRNLGFVHMDMDAIGDIIRPVITWKEEDDQVLFEYVLDCIMQFSVAPNAFMLADLINSRYQRRVDGVDDMGVTGSVRPIPN